MAGLICSAYSYSDIIIFTFTLNALQLSAMWYTIFNINVALFAYGLFVLLEFYGEGPIHLYGPLAPRVVGVTLKQQVALLFTNHSSTL